MIVMHLIGNLGKDATSNNVSGKNVINFSVAHTESWNNAQGEKQQKTTWVDCSYWTDKTGILPYLKKGTQVYIEGQPDARAYLTKDSGEAIGTLQCRVRTVQLLGGNKESNAAPAASSRPSDGSAGTASLGNASFAGDVIEPVDDLPF